MYSTRNRSMLPWSMAWCLLEAYFCHLTGEASPLVCLVDLGKLAPAAVSCDAPLAEDVNLNIKTIKTNVLQMLNH